MRNECGTLSADRRTTGQRDRQRKVHIFRININGANDFHVIKQIANYF